VVDRLSTDDAVADALLFEDLEQRLGHGSTSKRHPIIEFRGSHRFFTQPLSLCRPKHLNMETLYAISYLKVGGLELCLGRQHLDALYGLAEKVSEVPLLQ
jgi:hypothetical protein